MDGRENVDARISPGSADVGRRTTNAAQGAGAAEAPSGQGGGYGRWLVAVLLLAGIVAARLALGDRLSLEELSRYERQFRAFRAAHPGLIYGILFAAYVGVTALSLPGATAMTLLTAWLLGFWQAVVLVSFASTAGATLAFLLSRYLLRQVVERRFGERLAAFDAAFRRNGAWFLFTLRLIPAVPFFVINVAMGLTPIRPWTFWWVSQLGMLPGTMVYVYAGSQFPSLSELAERGVAGVFTPRVWAAFAVLAAFPLVLRMVARWLGIGARSFATGTQHVGTQGPLLLSSGIGGCGTADPRSDRGPDS